jgi:exosome complex exonuclease DIS3/RRP44
LFPLSRYSDVLVHRELAAALGILALPANMHDRTKVAASCKILNDRHRLAQQSGRDSVNLHTLIYFQERTVVEEARVTRVKHNGFSIIVPRYGIEGNVVVDGKQYAHDAAKGILVSKAPGGGGIKVFQAVSIKIYVDKTVPHRHCLVFQLVSEKVEKPGREIEVEKVEVPDVTELEETVKKTPKEKKKASKK